MHQRFIIIGIILLSLVGCSKQKSTSLEWETYKLEKQIAMGDSIVTFSFDGKCELPVHYDNRPAATLVRDQLLFTLFGENYLDYSNMRVMKHYCESLKEESDLLLAEFQDEGINLQNLRYDEILRGKVIWSTDSLISYAKELYVFTGGAHGLTSTTNMVFDLKTGAMLSESDIFYADAMDNLTMMLIQKANKMRNGDQLPKKNKDFIFDDPYPNGNFIVNYKGIEYLYNPYEIAPYSYGQIRIPLTIAEVMPMLKPGTVVYNFFSKQQS